MTFGNALSSATIRFAGLTLTLLLLAWPAGWLRAAFFPAGLSANALFLVVFGLILLACILMVTYVAAPLRQWWTDKEGRLRAQLEGQD